MSRRDKVILQKVISEIDIGAGMRDLTAHKYQTLRMEDVYSTVKQDFPKLKADLEKVLIELTSV